MPKAIGYGKYKVHNKNTGVSVYFKTKEDANQYLKKVVGVFGFLYVCNFKTEESKYYVE